MIQRVKTWQEERRKKRQARNLHRMLSGDDAIDYTDFLSLSASFAGRQGMSGKLIANTVLRGVWFAEEVGHVQTDTVDVDNPDLRSHLTFGISLEGVDPKKCFFLKPNPAGLLIKDENKAEIKTEVLTELEAKKKLNDRKLLEKNEFVYIDIYGNPQIVHKTRNVWKKLAEQKDILFEIGQTYTVTLPEPLKEDGSYYIQFDNKLFYVKEGEEGQGEVKKGQREVKLELILDQFSGEDAWILDFEDGQLNEERLLFITTAANKRKFFKRRNYKLHAHMKDQRELTAKFHLNYSVRSQVEQGLDQLELELNYPTKKFKEEQQKIEEEQKVSKQIEEEKAAISEEELRRKEYEADLIELDAAAFKAIQKKKKDALYWIAYIFGGNTAVTFGFIEGGSAMLAILAACALIVSLPSLLIKLTSFIWGVASTYVQWESFGKDTPELFENVFGKDEYFEGNLKYYNNTGIHKLTPPQIRALLGLTFLVGICGFAIGGLCYFSLSDLVILLGIGFSFSIPPLGMTIIAIAFIVFVAGTVSLMFENAYEGWLKSGKSLGAYLTQPFESTVNEIDENPKIKHKLITKILVGVLFGAAILLGVAGLFVTGFAAKNSIFAVLTKLFKAGPKIAMGIGIGVAAVSVGVRSMFTVNRANTAAKTLYKMSQERESVETSTAMMALSISMSMEVGAFFGKERPFDDLRIDIPGGFLTGVREFEGEVGGFVRFKEASSRECDYFEMSTVPTQAMLRALPGVNAAYIRVRNAEVNTLYYINKKEEKCIEVPLRVHRVLTTKETHELEATLGYLHQQRMKKIFGEQYAKRDCSFVTVSDMKTFDIKSIPTKEAYIRVKTSEKDLIYYVNKEKNKGFKAVFNHKTFRLPFKWDKHDYAQEFDNKFNRKTCFDNAFQAKIDAAKEMQKLSKSELEKLESCIPFRKKNMEMDRKESKEPSFGVKVKRFFKDESHRDCSLYFMKVKEFDPRVVRSFIKTEEAYIRVEQEVKTKEGKTKVAHLLYYLNFRDAKEDGTPTVMRYFSGEEIISAFDNAFADKMQKMMNAQALTAKQVKTIGQISRQYYHATSDADEHQRHRVQQYMKQHPNKQPAPCFFAEPKNTVAANDGVIHHQKVPLSNQ